MLVMYLGHVVELGPVDAIFERPLHPYTVALLGSRPSMDPAHHIDEPPLNGDPPSPINPPSGWRFRTRCAHAEAVCAETVPVLGAWLDCGSHVAACHIQTPGSGHSQAITQGMA